MDNIVNKNKIDIQFKPGESTTELITREGVTFFTYPKLSKTGIVNHGFSTRLGGVSVGDCATMNISMSRGDDPEAVMENKRRLAKAIGFEVVNMVFTYQTHTTNVAYVTMNDAGIALRDTDGLVTDIAGLCLVTFYADCVPLYFIDPIKKAIGLSHSGWRGTLNRMGAATVLKMKECFGSAPEDLIAAIGPSICGDCYEVGGDLYDNFSKGFDHEIIKKIFTRTPEDIKNGKYHLDLWKANWHVLRDAGLKPDNIVTTDICTRCNPDLFFSNRVHGERRGNLSAFLVLKA
ncbi:MAG: peptidoglycan editing factor PgeF [Lachnospiraceae bacterium]|jgi:YfiH family protein|nr:peptidoglycan editing factor PgeF [Lachnospiraceae bacterium]